LTGDSGVNQRWLDGIPAAVAALNRRRFLPADAVPRSLDEIVWFVDEFI
jgi:hypothetical protein